MTNVGSALVLAGGGIAGIAWETGILTGMQDESPDAVRKLLDADVILGTSAGATVAAQITSGFGLAELFDRQLAEPVHEIAPRVDIDELLILFEGVGRDAGASVAEKLRRIGEQAVATPTVTEQQRRSVIQERLPSRDWPSRRLEVTAIDVETGERVVFDRHSGVALVDAVAASCAVPAVWPPVTIGDRRYMDGGVASSANLDVVADCDTVVMLAPIAAPGPSPFDTALADELSAWPADRALGVFADDAAVRAFGRNPLDPRCRAASARAGREQGRRHAAELAEFLSAF